MSKYRFHLLILVLITALWTACTQDRDPCLQPKVVPVHVGIYQPADTGTLGRDSTLPGAVLGLVDTAVRFYDSAKGNKFNLQLSPRFDSTRWYIIPDKRKPGDVDTLTFYYVRQPYFVSQACGFVTYFRLNNVKSTNYIIDSVIVNRFEVTTEANIEHVKIFY